MGRRYGYLTIALLLGLGVGRARAVQEDAVGHTKHPMHTVVLDNEDVRPSTTTMDKGDVIVFENHSTHPIKITFTEPADQREKIRCGLVKEKAGEKARAPWQLFAWENGKLAGTIPPGRFASVCSLQEGNYTFLTVREGVRVQAAGGGTLQDKGEIVVK
jgi:hypothetical protein